MLCEVGMGWAGPADVCVFVCVCSTVSVCVFFQKEQERKIFLKEGRPLWFLENTHIYNHKTQPCLRTHLSLQRLLATNSQLRPLIWFSTASSPMVLPQSKSATSPTSNSSMKLLLRALASPLQRFCTAH
eukprot:m.12160 g.12160  ORF g.12160 m.12160 type:complete len:129 (+) comp6774_c0_seq2:344-730(+)